MKVIIDSKLLNQTGENLKIDLQDIIDNRNDEYVVAAKDTSYYVAWLLWYFKGLREESCNILWWKNYK